MSVRTCDSCGNAVEPDARFCGTCGTPVSDPVDLSSLPPPEGTPAPEPTPTEMPPPAAGQTGSPGGPDSRNLKLFALVITTAVVLLFLGVGVVVLNDRGSLSIIGGGDSRIIGNLGTYPLSGLPAEEPEEAWSEDLPGEVLLDTGARGDTLYVLTADTAGEYDDLLEDLTVTAYDTADGEERWDLDLDGDAGAVVMGDDLLLQGFPGFAAWEDGVVTGITADGEEAWSEGFRDDNVYASPLGGGRLLLQHSGGEDSEMWILDTATGEELFEEDGSLEGIEAGRHLVRPEVDEIALLDDSGDEVWSERTDEGASVSMGDGLVYLQDRDELLALDAATGEERWAVDIENEEYLAVRPIPGVGVLTSGTEGTEVFDLRGEELWDSHDGFAGQLVDRDGRLMFLRTEGEPGERTEVELLDAQTGDRLARTRLDEGTIVYHYESRTLGDVITRDHLIVREDEEVRVLDYDDDFDERWAVDADGDFATAVIAIPGGIVVFGADEDERTMVAYR